MWFCEFELNFMSWEVCLGIQVCLFVKGFEREGRWEYVFFRVYCIVFVSGVESVELGEIVGSFQDCRTDVFSEFDEIVNLDVREEM